MTELATARMTPRFRSRLVQLVRLWRRNAQSRAALRRLDADLRADVGLSEKQAWEEGRKPFWRS